MIRYLALSMLLLTAGCGSAVDSPPAADALEERPAQALYRMGRERAAAGDYVRAEQYLAAAVARGYPKEEAIGPLVTVCLRSSRLRAALGHAEPYLKQHPEAWPLRYLAAAIHLAVGQPAEARRELDRVIRHAPEHAGARYLMAVTLRDALGEAEAAAGAFRDYLALAPDGSHAREARAFIADQAAKTESSDPPAAPASPAEPAAPAGPAGGKGGRGPLRENRATDRGAGPIRRQDQEIRRHDSG